jgi:hypothetical protein
MTTPFHIHFLLHQQIDKKKWDDCIANAANGLIYGYSIYLDAMSDNWDALVLNDYEAVMPLTWKKKYGIHYLYQPFLTAQAGLFGNTISAALLNEFLKAIPKKFKYWDICLNHENVFPLADFNLYQRTNFILSLNKPYEELYKAYRENVKRNMQKAKQINCSIDKNFDVTKVIELAQWQMRAHSSSSIPDFTRFTKLYEQLQKEHKARTYGVLSSAGELLASCVFFFSHYRAYYILVGNHPNGKTVGASHLLIDAFIKDHAGQNIVLDFEGSDIRNLAFFYSSFGAMEEKYAAIKLNRLPFYVKWLKK